MVNSTAHCAETRNRQPYREVNNGIRRFEAPKNLCSQSAMLINHEHYSSTANLGSIDTWRCAKTYGVQSVSLAQRVAEHMSSTLRRIMSKWIMLPSIPRVGLLQYHPAVGTFRVQARLICAEAVHFSHSANNRGCFLSISPPRLTPTLALLIKAEYP